MSFTVGIYEYKNKWTTLVRCHSHAVHMCAYQFTCNISSSALDHLRSAASLIAIGSPLSNCPTRSMSPLSSNDSCAIIGSMPTILKQASLLFLTVDRGKGWGRVGQLTHGMPSSKTKNPDTIRYHCLSHTPAFAPVCFARVVLVCCAVDALTATASLSELSEASGVAAVVVVCASAGAALDVICFLADLRGCRRRLFVEGEARVCRFRFRLLFRAGVAFLLCWCEIVEIRATTHPHAFLYHDFVTIL